MVSFSILSRTETFWAIVRGLADFRATQTDDNLFQYKFFTLSTINPIFSIDLDQIFLSGLLGMFS